MQPFAPSGAGMRHERQHEVVRDASLSLATVLKNILPERLEKKQPVEVIFDIPDAKRIDKMRSEGKILISVIFLTIGRSTLAHSSEQPIIREEDENGEILEYKLGVPTFLMATYLFTPWTGDPLQDQVVVGAIMRIFAERMRFQEEDLQGESIDIEQSPRIDLIESFTVDKQMQLWRAWGQPYRAGVVYGVSLRMDSTSKTFVRRVKERVLDFKKLEG